tara:strand:- start:230 stop:538 length:309 start_codon:yes stop_codon:yes gene_type:complete
MKRKISVIKVEMAAPTNPINGINNKFNKILIPAVIPCPSILLFCLSIDDNTIPSRKFINLRKRYNEIILRAMDEIEYLAPYKKPIISSDSIKIPSEIGNPMI